MNKCGTHTHPRKYKKYTLNKNLSHLILFFFDVPMASDETLRLHRLWSKLLSFEGGAARELSLGRVLSESVVLFFGEIPKRVKGFCSFLETNPVWMDGCFF